MKKVVSLLCGLVLLGGGVGNHAHADDTIVLNFETGLGSQSVQQVRTLQAWSASVEEASKGRIKIHLYPNGSLAKPNVNLMACQDGLVDIAYLHSFFFTDRLKALEALYVPGLNITDPRAASLAVWDLIARTPAFHDEAKGVKILGVHVSPMAIGSVDKPVASVEDFEGLRLRTNGKSTALLAKRMGATVMTVPGPDIFMNLQKKIVEAAVAAWERAPRVRADERVRFLHRERLPAAHLFLSGDQRKQVELAAARSPKVLEDASGTLSPRWAAGQADIAKEMRKVRAGGRQGRLSF